MSNKEAYCVELGRVVNIIEARLEFLNQNKFTKFTFLCSNEECRNNGVKIIGANYHKHPSEDIKVTPYFKYNSKNNIPHSSGCIWILDQAIEKQLNETEDEYKLRKAKHTLNDYIDEFKIDDNVDEQGEVLLVNTTKRESTSIKLSSHKTLNENREDKLNPKYAKTNQLMRLVESYLNAKAKLPEKLFLKLPLKTPQKEISYLYQYFRRAEKVIIEKKICVYIGDCKFQENDRGLYFILQNKELNKTNESYPIIIYISKETFDNYRYRRALRDHINSNPYSTKYFKIYFIPEREQLNLRKKEKNGKETKFYFIEIKNLNHFCLFNYSTIKNIRKRY